MNKIDIRGQERSIDIRGQERSIKKRSFEQMSPITDPTTCIVVEWNCVTIRLTRNVEKNDHLYGYHPTKCPYVTTPPPNLMEKQNPRKGRGL